MFLDSSVNITKVFIVVLCTETVASDLKSELYSLVDLKNDNKLKEVFPVLLFYYHSNLYQYL